MAEGDLSASKIAERRIRKVSSWSFFPSHIWWDGPGAARNSAEPDHYRIQATQNQAYWKDPSRNLLFGPVKPSVKDPYPEWKTTIVAVKPRMNASEGQPTSSKTVPDEYGVALGNQFTKPPRSNALKFKKLTRNDSRGRFQVCKSFDVDYTDVGKYLQR